MASTLDHAPKVAHVPPRRAHPTLPRRTPPFQNLQLLALQRPAKVGHGNQHCPLYVQPRFLCCGTSFTVKRSDKSRAMIKRPSQELKQ